MENAQFKNKKLMAIGDCCEYLSMGASKTRRFLEEIGAKVRIGGNVLYDKDIIDAYIEKVQEEGGKNGRDQSN